jgi:hypothetical protein
MRQEKQERDFWKRLTRQTPDQSIGCAAEAQVSPFGVNGAPGSTTFKLLPDHDHGASDAQEPAWRNHDVTGRQARA